MNLLITAGPTQEPIDYVRYITNSSSGKMGLALAKAAIEQGHKVTVILGPVEADKPDGAKVINVRTAEEMLNEVLKELENTDVFISAAAVADYTPVESREDKIKSGGELTLKLKPTVKITRIVKEKYSKVYVVAFKAECNVSEKTLIERALVKKNSENLDLIIANDIGRNKMGSMENDVYIIDESKVEHIEKKSKQEIASELIKFISGRIQPSTS